MAKPLVSKMSKAKKDKCAPRARLNVLRRENRALRETLAIMSDKTVLREIEKSLHQLEKGKRIKLSDITN